MPEVKKERGRCLQLQPEHPAHKDKGELRATMQGLPAQINAENEDRQDLSDPQSSGGNSATQLDEL